MRHDIQTQKRALLDSIFRALPADNAPLSQAMRYSVAESGKFYRPLFCIYVGLALEVNQRDLLTIGTALELLHNFTLVHDDIMDAAAMRRGRPTVHMQWDTNLAILTGDALLARSLEILLSLNHRKSQLIEIFIHGLPSLSRGQALDLVQLSDVPDSIDDYRRMAAWKTGTIFSMAGEMAGAAAEVDPATRSLLKDLGTAIGIAYQLKDDYLDFFSDGQAAAKPMGSDLVLQKKSLLMSLGFKAAPGKLRDAITISQSDPAFGLQCAREVLVHSGVDKQVLNEFARSVAECLELVGKLPVDTGEIRKLLTAMLQLPVPPHNP